MKLKNIKTQRKRSGGLPLLIKKFEYYNDLKNEIGGKNGNFNWARKHTGYSKIDKLREYVELDKWSYDYKAANRNIHAGYYEMFSLYAMDEATTDVLLCGKSNSGLTELIYDKMCVFASRSF